MRIVSGILRGRIIQPPKNLRARPTTDFAKENLFNVIESHRDVEGADVLDLFAGTGDRKSTRLNSSHPTTSRMPSSA